MRAQFLADSRMGGTTPHLKTGALVYFFDLEPLMRSSTRAISNPDRLRLVCEKHIRSVAGADTVLLSDSGLYLAITSCSGVAAVNLVNYVNTSLLMLLFGTDSLTPEQSFNLYRLVPAEELPETTQRLLQLRRVEVPPSLDVGWDADRDGPRKEDARNPMEELARDGVYLEEGVELTFFPVHDLVRKTPSALFCAPTFAGAIFGHQAFQNLNPSELPYVDRAILMHSLTFARRLAEAGIVVAVGAPVSFETLAWSKSRQIYQWALRGAHVADMPQLILKIEDIPLGTPPDRIAQVVSAVRPFARHIFVHLPNDHVELGMTGRMGASGLVLSLQRRAAAPEILADCKYLSRAAVSQTAMSCIDCVESDEALNIVRSAGIRFAVGHVFGAETVKGGASIDDVRGVLDRIERATASHLRAIA